MATAIMTKSDEERVTARNNKLSFDEYTGRFFFESKIEGIQRTCKTRLKHVEAMNKGETLIMEGHLRQVEGKMHIFDMKNSRENDGLRDSLRDITAHKNALEAVGRKNDSDSNRSDMYGRYGMDATRKDLLPLIDLEKLKMDPSWRRKKECELLLSQRKRMDVIDRQQPTSRILLTWSNKKSKANAVNKSNDASKGNNRDAKLILPPITVKITAKKGIAKSVAGDIDTTEREDPETTSLPSVFITQVSQAAPTQ